MKLKKIIDNEIVTVLNFNIEGEERDCLIHEYYGDTCEHCRLNANEQDGYPDGRYYCCDAWFNVYEGFSGSEFLDLLKTWRDEL